MKKNYLSRLLSLVALFVMPFTLTFAQGVLEVTAPASVAGTYTGGSSILFGDVGGTVTGEIVLATDVDGLNLGCVAIDNSVTDVAGKIALIDRGACGFTVKALNAQNAGAIGVLICNNNQDEPDATINLGGFTCAVDIPVGMISYNDCQALRMESGVTGTFASQITPGLPNSVVAGAIEITDGTHTVDSIPGDGLNLFAGNNAVSGNVFYSYTAAADGVLNVNSCGGGEDTRLIIIGCGANVLGFNDDACDRGDGNEWASEAEVLVRAGQTVFIIWDNDWSSDGFDFNVNLGPLEMITLELNVNMEAEEVSPDGVNAVVAGPGAMGLGDVQVVAMSDDDGDGIYSGTVGVMTLDTIGYAFVNGAISPPDVPAVETVPADCGVPSGFGFNVRPLINTFIADASLAPVCFGLCTNCPQVVGTFTVDMANEEVGPDGVNMVVGGPGAADLDDVQVVPMTDNGDGTWSASLDLMTGDTIGYAFVNGMVAVENVETVPDDCGLPSGFGFNIRPLIVEGFADFNVSKVCFGTCLGVCPVEGCETTPTALDNIDNYELGADVTTQSADWVLWPVAGVIGGEVSDEQAASPPYSVKLAGGGSTGAGDLVDPLFNLGGVSTGAWDVRFKMYVPAGSSGYYNIQNNEGADPTQWNVEVGFESDGNLGEDLAGNGSYPQGEWFDIVNVIDLDNAQGEIIVNGVSVYTWAYGPDWSLGAINFFPRTGTEIYYVDDIVMRPIQFNGEVGCPEGSIICDGFESYSLGLVSPQAAAWTTWSAGGEGGGEDSPVVAAPVFEGCNAVEISVADPDDLLLLLGNRADGRYRLSWQNFIPAGSAAYYNIQEQETPGVAWNLDVAFNIGTSGPGEGVNETTGTTFSYPEDEWFLVEHIVDLDNNTLTLLVDSVEVETMPYEGNLGGVDYFGRDGVLYYIDNVLYQQLPALPGNACVASESLQDLFGQGLDNPVLSDVVDNTDYTTTAQDPDFGFECFNEPDGGGASPELNRTRWFTFEGDGSTYFIETIICDGAEDPIESDDTQFALYSGSCGSLEAVACNDDIDGAGGDFRAALEVETQLGETYYLMTDGFGGDFPADGQFCIQVTQLTEATVTVTFQVDASILVNNGELSAEGMFLAGGFNDFTGEPMTEGADNIWTLELALNPGETYNYKFQNGPGGWEPGLPADQCGFGDFGDRQVTVGDMDMTLDVVCFGFCVTCNEVSVDDTQLKAGVQVFPNPVKDLLNVRVDLGETADNLTVRMLNPFGQVITERYLGTFQTGNIEIDVTNIPAGAYMIQVMDGKAQYTQSVIVE